MNRRGGGFGVLPTLIVVPFLLVFSFLASSLLHAQTQVVTVGIYQNEPKVFIDETGKPAGIFVDIIEHIAHHEGWDVRYTIVTWAEDLKAVTSGDIDLMPDVAYTATRDAIFDFHHGPVLSDWFHVYARPDSGIKSIVDLEGKRVFVLERSVQQETFEQLAGDFGLNVTVVPPIAEKKGLEVSTDIADDVGDITTDRRRLEQVVLNLLNNAVKFTEIGHVRMICRNEHNGYSISVTDTGIGIPPEEIPRLFTPFHQIDTGTTRSHDGTGLGLAISKKLSHLETVPIIAVTSYAMVGDREKIFAAGANGYIEKPIDPDTFVEDILRYIRGARA